MRLRPLTLFPPALLSLFLWAGLTPSPTVYRVYYLGGQSNMDGFGYVKDLPETLREPMPEVRIFHGNQSPDNTPEDGRGIWAALRPGHGTGFSSDGETNTYSERFGVELTFAERLRARRPGVPIALVKYSRGGTAIDTLAPSFGTWDPDFHGENGVNQYDHFLATLRHAFASRDIDGDGAEDVLVPAGIVWMQGESDGLSEDAARHYEANLKRLMDLVRAALRVDDLPVVIGRISDSGQDEDGKVWDYGDQIRSAQAAFVAHDDRAALVTSTDTYAYSDPWHYDSAGFLDLGRRFADAMLALETEH